MGVVTSRGLEVGMEERKGSLITWSSCVHSIVAGSVFTSSVDIFGRYNRARYSHKTGLEVHVKAEDGCGPHLCSWRHPLQQGLPQKWFWVLCQVFLCLSAETFCQHDSVTMRCKTCYLTLLLSFAQPLFYSTFVSHTSYICALLLQQQNSPSGHLCKGHLILWTDEKSGKRMKDRSKE